MITIALPVYASPIVWFALEGLCNQNTGVEWELIVYEDEQYPMGEDFYRSYSERLRKAGCLKVVYKYSESRIALSQKWREISLLSSENSRGILLQAADNYSEPNRIEKANGLLEAGFDWIYSPRVLFFQLDQKKTMLYDCPGIGIGSDMAISREIAIQLPDEIKWQSVDSWIFDSIRKIKPNAKIMQDRTDDWKKGLATDGANRISLGRKRMFADPKPPFYKTDMKAEDCIGSELVNKLLEWKTQNP